MGEQFADDSLSASSHLASLLTLMRMESTEDKPGGCAILNALTSALFTLVLRAASEAEHAPAGRSEEHTSELQSLMRISYAVFCLKKQTKDLHRHNDLMQQHKRHRLTVNPIL